MFIFSRLKSILSLEKNWVAVIYGIMGVLLIAFPAQCTNAIPYMLGLGLMLRGAVSLVVIILYKRDSGVKAGWIIIDFVLGSAILFHKADSLGAIGAIWAMMSLYDVAEEVSESYETGHYNPVRMLFAAVTVVFAIMLMFDPFKHFMVHVRILGLEMMSSIFVRTRVYIRKKVHEHRKTD